MQGMRTGPSTDPEPSANEGTRVMFASQLLFEFFGRLAPQRWPRRLEDRPDGLRRRLWSAVSRRLRQHSPPPYLSDHLCRDIG
ncbi:MAG: hypothetical protein ACREUU_18945, partial [Gammaproteobacteria bacterium]